MKNNHLSVKLSWDGLVEMVSISIFYLTEGLHINDL